MAAVRILEMGGNAIDAGVAAGLCTNVLQTDMTNIGGVAPIMLYHAGKNVVRTISGLGTWPAATSREFFLNECGGKIPGGVHHCVMPAAVDAWTTALKEFGTLSFAEVAAPAIALAEEGFAAYNFFCENIAADAARLAQWPSNTEIYLPGGAPPRLGARFVQSDLGGLLRMLIEAEEGASHRGREAAIQAARDRFYTGDIAERTARFFEEQGGFLALDDLKNFHVDIEEPVMANYRGYQVYSCGPWCQGPVIPSKLRQHASFHHRGARRRLRRSRALRRRPEIHRRADRRPGQPGLRRHLARADRPRSRVWRDAGGRRSLALSEARRIGETYERARSTCLPCQGRSGHQLSLRGG
jgi:gamma-glutamyltranspeptidase/glutathione hydrolase